MTPTSNYNIGDSYTIDGKAWRIRTIINRIDGTFLLIARTEGKRQILQEVRV